MDPSSQKESADAGRWLNYAEIAALRRISKASAERLVRRRRWRKQTDNRGVARAYVPEDWCAAAAKDIRADVRRDDRAATTAEAFTAALAALREQQGHERTAWETERMRMTVVIDGFAKQTAEQRDQIAALQAKITQLEAADVRRIASRWARIRAAWRGE
jgi:hypothetical protein